MYLNQILEARALATVVGHSQTAADTAPLMVVQHVPSLGTGGAAATCAVAVGATMTFKVDAAAPAGKDAIGTAGVIDTTAGDYDTLGELADYINGQAAWRAILVGALREDNCTVLATKSAASCYGDNGLTLLGDTSDNGATAVPGAAGTVEQISIAISGEKFVNNGVNGHVRDADDECENSLLYAQVTLGLSGAAGLKLYSAPQLSVETELLAVTLTTATLQELGSIGTAAKDGVGSIFISANRGERLVVRAHAATAFSAVTLFNVLGKTAVLSGTRMVTEKNY